MRAARIDGSLLEVELSIVLPLVAPLVLPDGVVRVVPVVPDGVAASPAPLGELIEPELFAPPCAPGCAEVPALPVLAGPCVPVPVVLPDELVVAPGVTVVVLGPVLPAEPPVPDCACTAPIATMLETATASGQYLETCFICLSC